MDLRPASRYLPLITKLLQGGLDVKVSTRGTYLHPYTGKIIFLDNTIDSTTSTVLVKAQVPNPEQTLLPGEYVKVEVNVGDYLGVVVVPEQAVVEAQEGSRVLVIDDQNTVRLAVIKPLDTYEGLLAVESGLEPGQKVVVEGTQLVRPGQIVQAEELPLEKFVGKLRIHGNRRSPGQSPRSPARLHGRLASRPADCQGRRVGSQPTTEPPAPSGKISAPPDAHRK